jgi:hypothetical protein
VKADCTQCVMKGFLPHEENDCGGGAIEHLTCDHCKGTGCEPLTGGDHSNQRHQAVQRLLEGFLDAEPNEMYDIAADICDVFQPSTQDEVDGATIAAGSVWACISLTSASGVPVVRPCHERPWEMLADFDHLKSTYRISVTRENT